MNDTEHKKRMQVLRMAEIILKEENTKQFNIEYKNWIASNDVSWRTRGIKLAVPISPPPPTEEAIVARALEFYKAAVPPAAAPSVTTATAILSDDQAVTTDAVPTIVEQQPIANESTEVISEVPLPIIDSVLDPVRKIFETSASEDTKLSDVPEPATVADTPTTLTVPTSGVRDMLASLFQQKSQSNKTRLLNV